MHSRLLQALEGKNREGPPIWMMRQAGRYLPEYRALREGRTLKTLMTTPEHIVAVTKMPLLRYDLDAAIVFSDILVAAAGLGLSWDFTEGSGPVIEQAIRAPEDVARLPSRAPEEVVPFVKEGIEALVADLQVPLIGFCGGPFTVACYLLEGGRVSADVQHSKQWMWQYPEVFSLLLDKITAFSVDYLQMQERAGVKAIQIFDSWAGMLPPSAFARWVVPYLQRLKEAISVPVMLFCRGSGLYAEELSKISPAAISLDWTADMSSIRHKVPLPMALQGNLDPSLLFATKDVLAQEVDRLLTAMGSDPGFIFNLGHGILPKTPVDQVAFVLERVRHYGKR